jgi:hypothetical protein
MRLSKLAIIGVLGACVAFPAATASAAPQTWEQCHTEALKHGLAVGRAGSAEFMKQCMAGNTTSGTRPPAQLAGSFNQCEAKAIALGMPRGQTGHAEYVRECMGQRPRSRPTPN